MYIPAPLKNLIFIILLLFTFVWVMSVIANARADDLTENDFALASLYLINDTQEKQIYHVYWLDHDWGDEFPGPVERAGGELGPGKKMSLEDRYKPGLYVVTWRATIDHPDVGEFEVWIIIYPETKRITVNTTTFFTDKDSI